MAARRKTGYWLHATLAVLLVLFAAGLWLSLSEGDKPGEAVVDEVKSGPPAVVFEDARIASELRVIEEPSLAQTGHSLPRHGIGLIMDDVGYDLAALRRTLALPFPVAISVLPDAPHATRSARMAHQAGRIIMLHLPMEPGNPKYSSRMDDAFLTHGMNREQIRSLTLQALASVPYVLGVNNHMGSRLTEMEEPMRWVMDLLKQQQVFFIDSRTSQRSVAAKVARETGLDWGERGVFLDHSLDDQAMRSAWHSVMRKLKRNGYVIVIAHPHEETLDFLEKRVSSADQASIVPVSQLLFAGQPARISRHHAEKAQTLR